MNAAPARERRQIVVGGIVQGVGFRPFIYALAHRYGLSGFVRNDSRGVCIEVEGSSKSLEAFIRAIRDEAPSLASVEDISWQYVHTCGGHEFRIEESDGAANRVALISPDVATCDACLSELFDPADRRFRYPFINCTSCGPRFTITRSIPYDRATTTMARFEMCPDCWREYVDPADRRFHAQPNACPRCGPRVRLLDCDGREIAAEDDTLRHAARFLQDGAILAVKGLGGFHLACDPFNADAVGALRRRKVRQDRPFALMALDLAQVKKLCRATPEEAELVTSPARPIVLLERRESSPAIADQVAPRQRTLGVMLAYTPLHHVLLRDAGIPLVMTSGNRSDEPITYRDAEMVSHLGRIADYFLVHDREIHMRCDDSVTRVLLGVPYPVRRSRGYAPAPLTLVEPIARPVLATGGELKNTFCLARGRHAFMSHHIGDLENYESLRSYKEGIEHFSRLFGIRPEVVAYDLHPEYVSTKYARELEDAGMPAVGVQHHRAHIASCLADNGVRASEPVIGVAMDGTGYGDDGAIWGAEIFRGSVQDGLARCARLAYVPMPGGEAAIRQPWRMAIAHLLDAYGEERTAELPLQVISSHGERTVRLFAQLARTGLNAPLTSSAGRLFDAVAALLNLPGTTAHTTYEGQAAVELELASGPLTAYSYPFQMCEKAGISVIQTSDIITAIVDDLLAGLQPATISARFHRTMAKIVLAACLRVRDETGTSTVALSGGTFQNTTLLNAAVELLREANFVVLAHRNVPTNDGGLALGQVILANAAVESGARWRFTNKQRTIEGERRQHPCA